MRLCLTLALSLLASVAPAQDRAPLVLDAQITLDSTLRDFGGLSAIAVEADGDRARALSDRGKVFDLALQRDPAGSLTGGIVLGLRQLFIYEPRIPLDSEGIDIGPDGSLFVSAEQIHEVLRYPPGRYWPEHMEKPELPFKHDNRAIEALARDAQGRLLIVPEAPLQGDTEFAILRLEDGVWTRIGGWEKRDTFLVVGADIGPDGRLYVLERAASLLGFRSRIRRVDLSAPEAGEQVLYTSMLGQFDNLEGIDVWRDAAGQSRITLVSDDNFSLLQRSEIVEFLFNE